MGVWSLKQEGGIVLGSLSSLVNDGVRWGVAWMPPLQVLKFNVDGATHDKPGAARLTIEVRVLLSYVSKS
ncbi:hypothetical protein V6N13_048210 [Hibiscus sabdariffa]